jgi:hypothetical protein
MERAAASTNYVLNQNCLNVCKGLTAESDHSTVILAEQQGDPALL